MFRLGCLFAGFSVQAGNYFQGVSHTSVFWPGGVVPYLFDTNYTLTSTQKSVIIAGLREWELAANVKFVPYTNQANYVLLQYTNDGSGSGYCLLGTPATIMLHGLARGLMCHEGGHLLGLQHEHQRIDRNSYIVINTNNILGSTNGEGAFVIDTNSTAFGPYDLQSVMHYSPGNFSIGPGFDALDPLSQYWDFYHKLGNLALSIGDRAAVSNLYGPPSIPLSNFVTNTADGGPGSLRAAIYYANDHPGTTVRFNIPNTDPGYSNGVYTIDLIGELPPLVSPGTIIDGTSQPGYLNRPIVVLDGSQVSPETGPVSGLHFYGTNCTVQSLAFNNFNYVGIQLFAPDAVSNHVQGCYFGLKPDGTNAAPNNEAGAIFQFGAHNNFIGGDNPLVPVAEQRNVLSGNVYYGIQINDTNSNNNLIEGNYIGLNAAGTGAVANGYSGIGIWDGPAGTVIGGTNSGARNVISGNSADGINVSYANVSGVVIQGNYLGTDFTGSNAVPNANAGVNILAGAHGVVVGGTNAAARNIVSGNAYAGVIFQGIGTTNNVIQGNYAGTDLTGSNAVPNGQIGIGVWGGATGNLVGGTNTGSANVASGNLSTGILVSDPGTGNNVVQGNLAGTDPTGKHAVPNGSVGIAVGAAGGNLIGGTVPGARNIVSGNGYTGIVVSGAGATNNLVQGNYVGIDVTGTNALPNNSFGIGVWGGATGNLVGGTTSAAANVASGNYGYGIFISDIGTSNNLVQGNLAGTDPAATIAIPNGEGIEIGNGANNNLVGGLPAGARNLASGNYDCGILIGGAGCYGNVVEGNLAGTDLTGRNALANQFAGIGVWGASFNNTIGGTAAGAANVASGNASYGVYISDTNTSGNSVQGNLIGVDVTGTNALGNGIAGVRVQKGATANVIGGIAAGQGNVISHSGGPGVVLFDPVTTNNAIRANSIFNNSGLGIDLNNDGVTANHVGFLAGPNDLQNYPVITNAFGYAATTVVRGKFNSLASRTFSIDVYRNPSADPSGFGEGQFYLGTVSVTTDGSGNALFAFTNTAGNFSGQYLTATAVSAGGDTSEFGADVLATNAPAPSVQFTGPLVWHTNGFVLTLTLQTNFSYRIQAATNLANPIVWTDLTNYAATHSSLTFTDRLATNFHVRFYRAVSP